MLCTCVWVLKSHGMCGGKFWALVLSYYRIRLSVLHGKGFNLLSPDDFWCVCVHWCVHTRHLGGIISLPPPCVGSTSLRYPGLLVNTFTRGAISPTLLWHNFFDKQKGTIRAGEMAQWVKALTIRRVTYLGWILVEGESRFHKLSSEHCIHAMSREHPHTGTLNK